MANSPEYTSPHFYTDLANEHGDDLCDRVKIFLDSIRNGQHFGQPETGKITNPIKLLDALLNKGWVGPATAIGTGYVLPEKAGIIRVNRESNTTWKYKLHLVQTDTVSIVRNLVTHGVSEPSAVAMRAANFQPEASFKASETIKASVVTTVEFVNEAEADLISMMREQECRT